MTLPCAFGRSGIGCYLAAGVVALGVRVALADTAVTIAGNAYTLTAHPRVLFDGPDGPMVECLQDPDGAGPRVAPQASERNPAFVALEAQIRGCVGTELPCTRDSIAADALLAALDWFMDNSQTRSLAAVRHWLNHVEEIATAGSGFGCGLTNADCGLGPRLDQASADLAFYALAYTLIRDRLSQAERTAFARKILNGFGATDEGCKNQLRPPPGGVVDELQPWDADTCGLVWMLQHHTYNPRGRTIGFAKTALARSISAEQDFIPVASVADLPARFPYRLSIDGGEVVQVTAADGTKLAVARAQLGTTATAVISGKPVYYSRVIPNVGTDDYAHSFVIQRLFGYAFIGNALADDSDAARQLLDAAVDDWLKYVHPKNKDMWTGFQQGGSGDAGAGQLTQNAAMTAMLMRFKGSPSLDKSGGDWLKHAVPAYLLATLPPAPDRFVPWGQPDVALSASFDSHQWAPILSGIYGPSNEASQYWNHWQRKVTGQYDAAHLRRDEARRLLPYALMYYQESDPSLDYKDAYTPQRAFTVVDGTASRGLAAWISRGGWTNPHDTLVFANAFPSAWSLDHIGAGAPGAYKIYKNGWVLTENGPHDTGAGADTNMPIFGDAANLTPSRLVSVTRVANDDRHHAYSYFQINSQAAYHAKASVTRALRSIVHLKKAGTQDYVFVYDSLESWAGTTKTINLYFDKTAGEEGAMTSSTLPNLVWTGPDRRSSSTLVMPSGAAVAAGYTPLADAHQVAVCASTDGKTCDAENTVAAFLVVHRPSIDVADVMPRISGLQTISANFVGAQVEGDHPSVVVFPAAGVPRAGISFTTSYAGRGQLLVTGMEAGLYDVNRDGVTICKDVAVEAAAETVYCELESGAIELVRVSEDLRH